MNLAKFGTQKEFSFNWNAPLHSTDITINVPVFTHCTYKKWSDWRPIFDIDLDTDHLFKVCYADKHSGTKEEYILDMNKLELSTLMLARDRENFHFI